MTRSLAYEQADALLDTIWVQFMPKVVAIVQDLPVEERRSLLLEWDLLDSYLTWMSA